MDLKAAYFEARGYLYDIHVLPSSKLVVPASFSWKLTASANQLVESGRF